MFATKKGNLKKDVDMYQHRRREKRIPRMMVKEISRINNCMTGLKNNQYRLSQKESLQN